MTKFDLLKIVKYKYNNNITLPEVARIYCVGINRLRKLLHHHDVKISKKHRTYSERHKMNLRKSMLVAKDSPILKYDWNFEYNEFIKMNKKDRSFGIRKYSKYRDYPECYLRKYIRYNNLYQPRGIVERNDSWKSNISKSLIGKISNPKGSNGKLKNKTISNEHRYKISESLVNYYHNISYNDWISKKSAREIYYKSVWHITNKQPLPLLANHDNRGNAGVVGNYQLDHIYPISVGFENNISPETIGYISNLRFISWEENIKKSNIV